MKKAIDVLARAAREDELTHAYLAPARRGVNLTRYGRKLAEEIMCGKGKEACREKIREGTDPDLIEVTPAKVKLSIDQIRDIKRSASRSPVNSRRKVYLVNKAEDLSLPAANSLLKILESPPGYVIFLLLSNHPSEVPPTVTSRCQRLPRGGFSEEDLRDLIEGFGKDLEETRYVMEVVDNREDLLEELDLEGEDQLVRGSNLREEFRDAELDSLCGLVKESQDLIEKHEAVRKIFLSVPEVGEFELLELAEELSKLGREELSDFIRKGTYIYRKMLFSQIEDGEGEGPGFRVEYSLLADLNKSLREISRNVNKRLVLETVFLDIRERVNLLE